MSDSVKDQDWDAEQGLKVEKSHTHSPDRGEREARRHSRHHIPIQKTSYKSSKTTHRRDYKEDDYSTFKPVTGHWRGETDLKRHSPVSNRCGAGTGNADDSSSATPASSLLMAVGNPPHHMDVAHSSRDIQPSSTNAAHASAKGNAESDAVRPSRGRGITPPLLTPPGAVAVTGLGHSNAQANYDDYTITAPQQEVLDAPPALFETPVTATLVYGDEEDLRDVQEQLRQRDDELQRMRAAQQNIAVGQVIAQNDSEEGNTTGDKSFLLCLTTRKWIVGIAAIVLIVGIVLGLVLSSDGDPAPSPSPAEPTQVPPVSTPVLPTVVPPTEPGGGGWSPVGQDLVGQNNGDIFGISIAMSANGQIIAVGAPLEDNKFEGRGSVRTYVWNETAWTQLGGAVYGEKAGDFFGWPVALSWDGTVMAAGARHSDENGESSGQVRVFEFVNDDWSQVGSSLNGETEGDQVGSYMLDLSANGTVLAVGALNHDGPEGAEPDRGVVYVFSWDGYMWGQLGEVIYGESSGDLFGHSVALSANATIMAVGAARNDNNGVDSGNVQTFQLVNGKWAKLGTSIVGLNAQDWFGQSVALSADGAVLAVGAPFAKVDGSGTWSGHARVFRLVDDDWTQVGSTLIDENEDEFGCSVALSSDGTILAVAALGNDVNGESSGQVRVFRFIDNDWIQVGNAMNGHGAEDTFGNSLAMSADGMTVAGGAPQWEKDGNPPGYVMVYRASLDEE